MRIGRRYSRHVRSEGAATQLKSVSLRRGESVTAEKKSVQGLRG